MTATKSTKGTDSTDSSSSGSAAGNGHAPAAAAAADGTGGPVYSIDAGKLTINDLRRAKVMLGGRDPQELMADSVEQMQLTVWCLASRTNPGFTWEEAGEVPFESFDAQDIPPLTLGGPPNGSPPGEPERTSGKPKRPAPARGRSSASSTG